MPQGWRVLPVGAPDSLAACREGYDTTRHQRYYEIETEDGRAKVYPYDGITHYIESGAGFCMAVAIANQDYELFAVGIHEDRCAWDSLPGIAMSDFRKGRE